MWGQDFGGIFTKEYVNAKELNALIRRYKKHRHDERKFELRDEIFFNVARFIRKTINSSPLVPIDDRDEVFNEAVIAFYSALDNYRVNLGFTFTTYLHYWVKKAIYDYKNHANIIHIYREAFTNESTKDAAVRATNQALIYIDKPLATEESDNNLHFMPKDENAEDNIFAKLEQGSMLDFLKNNLTVQQFIVIRFRYLVEEPWTLDDFEPILNVGRERVRHIEAIALNRLRKVVANEVFFTLDNANVNSNKMPSEEALMAHNDAILRKRDFEKGLSAKKFVLK